MSLGRVDCNLIMDLGKILIWKAQGLISGARQDSLRTFVDACRADIVFIQETKMSEIPRRVLLSAFGD